VQFAPLPGQPSAVLLRRQIRWLLIGFVLVNIAWRAVRYALRFPIWGDEAMVLSSLMSRNFGDMLRPLDYLQIAPLGFMWAELIVVRLLGFSEHAVRAIPFVCGIASMLLFWRLAIRIASPRSALIAVGVLAASYYPVRHAAEVKPYAIDMLVSLAAIYLGWKISRNPFRKWYWTGLILLGGVGPWVSYPFVFAAGAVGAYLICVFLRPARPKAGAMAIIYCILLTASFASMYLLYGKAQGTAASHLVTHKTWAGAFPPLDSPWNLPLWLAKVHTGNMMAYPIGGRSGRSALTLALVLIGAITLWRRDRRVLLLLLGPLLLNFVAAAMKRYPYGTSARVSLYLGPGFCLLCGIGLGSLLRRSLRDHRLRNGLAIALCILGSIATVGIARDIIHPYKKRSAQINRSAMRWLSEQMQPGDRWIVYNALNDVPYAPNLMRWGGSAARFRYYVTRFAGVPVYWGPRPGDVPPTTGQTWLIVYRGKELPFDEEMLKFYVQRLTDRFGPCEPRSFDLAAPEGIEICRFAAPVLPGR